MPIRLAYVSETEAFALLRLLLMSDRDKDVEILAPQHQITVLERRLGRTSSARSTPCASSSATPTDTTKA